jgi:hypothetical protein
LSHERFAAHVGLRRTSRIADGTWAPTLGKLRGEITAAAMVDWLAHHAEILSLKGDSYRLKDRDLGRAAPDEPRPTSP